MIIFYWAVIWLTLCKSHAQNYCVLKIAIHTFQFKEEFFCVCGIFWGLTPIWVVKYSHTKFNIGTKWSVNFSNNVGKIKHFIPNFTKRLQKILTTVRWVSNFFTSFQSNKLLWFLRISHVESEWSDMLLSGISMGM